MNMNKMEKLNKLFEDAAFAQELKEMQTLEEIQNLLAGKGIAMTTEELEEVAEKYGNANDTELSDDQMENVAGGGAVAIGLVAFGVATFAGFVKKQLNKSSKKSSKKR